MADELTTELGWRVYDLALLCEEMCQEIAALRRRPPVIVVVREGCETYEGEAEDVEALPEMTERGCL